MKKIDWLILIFIFITSFAALKDLFKPGFYTSHDGIHQIVRLYYFDQSLHDGQIPPRWAGGLLNGFGYPLFIFSYHMPWIIAEPLHFAGLSIIDSVKMTFLIGFILSGITMYFFQRDMFGRMAAFVGTMIYLYSPYRFSNIFVRGAIGDATSFIFPPLIFLALWKIKNEKKVSWIWISLGSFSFAGLFLSHAMLFLFFLIAVIGFILFSILFIRRNKEFLFSTFSFLMLTFGLSGYYFIPSIVEKNLTNFTRYISTVYANATFLDIKQLLYSPWGYGTVDAKEGAMSLQLGIAQWIIFLLFTIVLISLILKKKFHSEDLKEIFFYFLLFIFSIFLMLSPSKPIWNILYKIVQVDFVWRILIVSVFSVSVLSGFIIKKIKFPLLFGFIILVVAFYTNRNYLRINKSLDWSMPFYLSLEKTTNSYDEYTPKWERDELVKIPKPKVELLKNDGNVKIKRVQSNLVDFDITVPKGGRLRINTVYYPGWEVNVNGRNMPVDYEGNGLIEFPVKRGESRVKVQFTETPLRLFSDFLTVASFGFIFFIVLKFRKS